MTLLATDGVVSLRAWTREDVPLLIAGRDEQSRRWLGPGDPNPHPTACIVVAGEIVGWVDAGDEFEWLAPGEVNLGYNVFAPHRGEGYASRAVQLLLHHLAVSGAARLTSLRISHQNHASLSVAGRLGFHPTGEAGGQLTFNRPVPPLTYSDGTVTIRRQQVSDAEGHLGSIDEEQIRWMWLPGDREHWDCMDAEAKLAHLVGVMQENHHAFAAGPKWCFAVDDRHGNYVAYVDCSLAVDDVPAGEANISYSCHPAYRGRGYVSRAVRLVLDFLKEHTAAREAYIRVEPGNQASLRVAAAVGARGAGQSTNEYGNPLLRHVLDIRGTAPGT